MNSLRKKLRLNERQEILFEIFCNKQPHDLDDIVVSFGNDVYRSSLISTINTLSAKMVPFGYSIVQTTPLGRGNRAVYQMRKLY